MSGPLEGIQIIDCTTWIQGASAGAILGDLGASVIKVEERTSGDGSRGALSINRAAFGQATNSDSHNYYFEFANRNKRGITLDLQEEKGKKIMYRLVEKSDVFLENWRAGVAKKLGMDYESLSKYNPKIVYGRASGFGPEGPDNKLPAFEYTATARAGAMYIAGERGSSPQGFAVGVGDQIGAVILVQGVLAAICAKERLGIGQKVETSLLGSLMCIEGMSISSKLILGEEHPRRSQPKAGNPLSNCYMCADGKAIVISMLQADRYWPTFCKTMGIEELTRDPKFENMAVRSQNTEELVQILNKVFTTKTRDEWVEHFSKQGDLIYAPVQTISEVVDDPQALANEYVIEFNHPVWGTTRETGFPWEFSKTPASARTAAPAFGQHTEEVLLELGYSWNDISQLKQEEVI